MNCLEALGAMAAEEKILAIRLRSTVIYKKDLARLGLNIGAMDFEEEEWEVGWLCETCDGAESFLVGAHEFRCMDCEDGLRWEYEY